MGSETRKMRLWGVKYVIQFILLVKTLKGIESMFLPAWSITREFSSMDLTNRRKMVRVLKSELAAADKYCSYKNFHCENFLPNSLFDTRQVAFQHNLLQMRLRR